MVFRFFQAFFPFFGCFYQFVTDLKYKTCLGYVLNSSSAPRLLGAAYVPILLSEVEQEQRLCVNEYREAIVVGADLCDGEGERAYVRAWIFQFLDSFIS